MLMPRALPAAALVNLKFVTLVRRSDRPVTKTPLSHLTLMVKSMQPASIPMLSAIT